jgi:hypothetical protein
MRALLFATIIAGSLPSFADDAAPAQRFGDTLSDPRQPMSLYQMFDSGEVPKAIRHINNSILIICWMPAPDGTFGRFQISGLDGYHTKEQVEKFLNRFYDADHQKETQMDTPNVVLAGNNWGAGLELKETLKALSAKKAIAVYYVGGWAFSKASLIPEPDSRKRLITRTYEEASK